MSGVVMYLIPSTPEVEGKLDISKVSLWKFTLFHLGGGTATPEVAVAERY